MICLRLTGRKGRSNPDPTTELQQRDWLPNMATVNRNDPGTSSSAVATETATGTDKRIKFLCSYGGKILPRPSDGQLKYVGGETRVVCVPRSISFLDLSTKIEDIFKVGKLLIKYCIMSEDLDTLVSVKCNNDLAHMWEEHDQLVSLNSSPTSAPRFLRLFLFPSPKSPSPSRVHNYIDAINGQQIDPPLNHHQKPSRDSHAESLSFCHVGDPTEHHVEVPRAGRVVPSPCRNQFQRVWSTPNLSGAHQAGWDGAGPSCQTQCEHVYQHPVQLMGLSHQQACGRSDMCRCGNVCGYPLPAPVKPPLIRVSSYQNLNIACQAGQVVSDQKGSKMVLSPRDIGKGVQNSIPSTSLQNPMSSNFLQNAITNNTGVQYPINNFACVQTPVPSGSSVQNLIPSCSGAFGSIRTMCTKHVPLEVGSNIYVQQPRSGTVTPVGNRSRAATPVRRPVAFE